MAILHGSCLCGAVRFEFAEEDVERVGICHCTTCKRLAGGGATVSALLPGRSIRIVAGEEALRTYQPDEGSAKTFCGVCGSNLFGSGWPDSERAAVRLPAIDWPFDFRPQAHIYTGSAAPWETLPDDGLPRT